MDERQPFFQPPPEPDVAQEMAEQAQPESLAPPTETPSKETELADIIKSSEANQETPRSTLQRIANFQASEVSVTPPAELSQMPAPEAGPENPMLAARMDQDPRFLEIRQRINDDHLDASLKILGQQGMTESQARFHMGNFGSGYWDPKGKLRVNVASAEGVQRAFAQDFPAEYAAYREAEKSLVYQSANQDPAFNELQDKVKGLEDQYRPLDSGHEYRGYKSQDDIATHAGQTNDVYAEFAATYPEKAAAYWKSDRLLAKTLAGQEGELSRTYLNAEEIPDWRFDPAFAAMGSLWEPSYPGDSRSITARLSEFSRINPEKARLYAEQEPSLEPLAAPKQPDTEENPLTEEQTQALPIVTHEQIDQPETNPQAEPVIVPQPETDPLLQESDGLAHDIPPIDQLATDLNEQGLNVERIKVPGTQGDILMLHHTEGRPADTARIYRGHNQLDASILTQSPYAMRTLDRESGKVHSIEGIRQRVVDLANQPTYANLASYAEAMRPNLFPLDQERMDREIADLEDGVLAGYSVRQGLMMNQIGHAGGVADAGLSPYLSASFDPTEALGYTRSNGSLLVIDLPLSAFDAHSTNGEAYIKGGIDPKYITAIVPRTSIGNDDEANNALASALGAIPYDQSSLSQNPLRLQEMKREQERVDREFDALHRDADVLAIQLKRTGKLRGLRELSLEPTAQEAAQPYTATARKVLTHYTERLKNLSGQEPDISDYEYIDRTGRTKPMDPEDLNPEMLLRLKEVTEHREKRKREREETT